MIVRPWLPVPQAGDIVQCRFPNGLLTSRGQQDRPVLIVEVDEDPRDEDRCIVRFTYGTSHDVEHWYPGELTVRATDPRASFDKDTKFDLGNHVRLPLETPRLSTAPGRRFGNRPKRGIQDLRDLNLERALQAAISEAREAGRLWSRGLRDFDRMPSTRLIGANSASSVPATRRPFSS